MERQIHTIAVLGGTGAEGSGIALRLARAGHRVIIGSRDAAKAERACTELSALAPGVTLAPASNQVAAAQAQVVFLTVPHAGQQKTVQEVRAQLAGKILVDATVPLVAPKVARVQLPEGGSAVAAVQRLLGDAVRVVSAFQNVSAQHLRDLAHVPDCDVLVCGDDPEARELVIGLAADMGLRAWHAGSIANSAATEALTSLLIAMNARYKVPGTGIRITGLPERGSARREA
jgi:8-hydroxy-5-deazaflavin:NADPH oxidoreductase